MFFEVQCMNFKAKANLLKPTRWDPDSTRAVVNGIAGTTWLGTRQRAETRKAWRSGTDLTPAAVKTTQKPTTQRGTKLFTRHWHCVFKWTREEKKTERQTCFLLGKSSILPSSPLFPKCAFTLIHVYACDGSSILEDFWAGQWTINESPAQCPPVQARWMTHPLCVHTRAKIKAMKGGLKCSVGSAI